MHTITIGISHPPQEHIATYRRKFYFLQYRTLTLHYFLYHPGTKTYFNIRNGIEPTLTSAYGKGKLNNIDKIDVHDPCGSDHFPVLYSFNRVPPKCTIQGSENGILKSLTGQIGGEI